MNCLDDVAMDGLEVVEGLPQPRCELPGFDQLLLNRLGCIEQQVQLCVGCE